MDHYSGSIPTGFDLSNLEHEQYKPGEVYVGSGIYDNQTSFHTPDGYHNGSALAQDYDFGEYGNYHDGLPSVNHMAASQYPAFIQAASHLQTPNIDLPLDQPEGSEAPINLGSSVEQEDVDGSVDQEEHDGLRIRNVRQLFEFMAQRILNQREEKERELIEVGDQVDFPDDESEQRACVKRLVDAIKDTSNIIDKPCKDGRPAQAALRIDRGFYPDQEIEMVSWQIFLSLRDSQMGVRLVKEFHAYRYEKYESFETRLEAVVETLRQSKAACKQLLDPTYIDRISDAPDSELTTKLSNKRVNAERDTQNELGRKVMNGKIQPDDLSSLKVKSEDESNLTPTGRRRSSGRINRVVPRGKMMTIVVTPKKETPGSNKKSTPAPKSKTSRTLKRKSNRKIKDESDSEEKSDEPENKDDDIDRSNEINAGEYITPRFSARLRAIKAPNYDDGDFYQSDDSYHPDMETPTKKPRLWKGRGVSSGSAVKSASAGNLAPSPLPFRGSARHVPEPLQIPSQLGVHPNTSSQLMPNTLAESPKGQYDPKKDNRLARIDEKLRDVYDAYRVIICRLLEVDQVVGRKYSLTDLRFYARAYNKSFALWYFAYPETPGWRFQGHTAYQEGGDDIHEHFAQVLPRFTYIAKVRGDLTDSGAVNPNPPAQGFFNSNDDDQARALGNMPTPFDPLRELYDANPPALLGDDKS